MLKKLRSNPTLVAMIGTALEYYDMSLYWFMTPILTEIFLPKFAKIDAIIISFLALPVGAVIRPLGALIIGRIGDKYGRKRGLIISMTGMAIATGLTGLLPTYATIGMIAPLLMLICRSLQSFFVAGEYNGASIFVLEYASREKQGYTSGVYCAYTVCGILSASAVATAISHLPVEYWRLPYLIGFLTAIVGVYIRKYTSESPEFAHQVKEPTVPLWQIFTSNKKAIIKALAVSGFFGALYNFHTALFNSFLPMVTKFDTTTILYTNTCTTIIYFIFLPIAGYYSDRIGIRKTMLYATIATILLVHPLVSLLKLNSLAWIFFVKAAFAVVTAWFVGPFHAYMLSLFEVKARYTGISICYSIGGQLGGAIPAISLWFWKNTHSYSSVSLALLIWAMLTAYLLSSSFNARNR